MLLKRLLLSTILIGNICHADIKCADQFVNNTAPITSLPNTELICFDEYAALYSNIHLTSVFTAEHLTKSRVEIAHYLDRKDAFHVEKAVMVSAKLSDYESSNYDRGHLAPNDDMSTLKSQYQSFSLINIIPQNSNNNRVLWKGLESAVRQLTRTHGEVYVISGPIYTSTPIVRLQNRVAIPDQLFKAVYIPATNIAAVYLVTNQPGMQYQVITVKQLQSIIHIDLFPSLPEYVKKSKRTLPKPYFGKW